MVICSVDQLFICFHVEENEPQEDARDPLFLRVAKILFNFPPARPILNFLPCKWRFSRARHLDLSGNWHL